MKSVGIAILGFLPIITSGLFNSILISLDALLTKLSRLVFMPGAIAPPKNSPLSDIILKVVAVSQ